MAWTSSAWSSSAVLCCSAYGKRPEGRGQGNTQTATLEALDAVDSPPHRELIPPSHLRAPGFCPRARPFNAAAPTSGRLPFCALIYRYILYCIEGHVQLAQVTDDNGHLAGQRAEGGNKRRPYQHPQICHRLLKGKEKGGCGWWPKCHDLQIPTQGHVLIFRHARGAPTCTCRRSRFTM